MNPIIDFFSQRSRSWANVGVHRDASLCVVLVCLLELSKVYLSLFDNTWTSQINFAFLAKKSGYPHRTCWRGDKITLQFVYASVSHKLWERLRLNCYVHFHQTCRHINHAKRPYGLWKSEVKGQGHNLQIWK